ncbi:hypothetical protein GLOIN_2v1772633 [Rhizophagus irregularis DAOM 181602=DAOM 197198]|nr:hypothetical protein GLOIN_2v1772633 [Rhizophagus irregularis DAOM 181602=DAOM 197198]
MRVRIAAPADLDAFFNELQKLADIAVRLGHTGDITNPVAIHTFIESDLTRKTGHSKNKCSRSRRTKKVNNTHIVDYEESESDEETDEETEEELTEEEEEEDEPQNCFSVKKKLVNVEFHDYPVSERKKLWDVLSANMQDILSPLAHAVNTATPLLPTPPADVPSEVEQKEDKTLNHAIHDPNDVVTISCKIKNVCIPYAMIDTGSDSSVISENVAKHLGLKIDRKNIHALNGVAGSTKTLGTINEIPITIGEGTNTVTISDEFSVIPTEKDRNVKGEFKANVNGQPATYKKKTS